MRCAPIIAALACFGLAACASAPKPDLRLPAAYEAPPGPPAGAVELDRWWTQFNDPQLDALIEQALVANPDAWSAAARIKEARANRASILSQFLPQGDLTGSTRRSQANQISINGPAFNVPGFTLSGMSRASRVDMDVNWEIDLFGRVLGARRAANADVAAARFNYEATRASLAAQVADAYFQARGFAIQLADAQQTARIRRSLYELADKRAKAGLAPTSEPDRVSGDLAVAEAQARTLDAELQVERRTLLILAGRTIEPLSAVDIPPNVGAPPAIPVSLPSQLLERRPDVREAEMRLAVAAGRADIASRAFFPTFNLLPGVGWQSGSQPGFAYKLWSWSAGGAFTQPVLSIPQLIADLRVRNAQTEQAAAAYEKSVQTAFAEAEAAMMRLDAARRRVELLTDGEARAARAYHAQQRGYELGLIDLQTTLSAEESWRSVRVSLAAAQVDALRQAVQAYKAIGGGWSPELYPTLVKAAH